MKKMHLFLGLCCAILIFAEASFAAQLASTEPLVKIETNLGDILVQLNSRKAPISTANFIQYVKSGHYDGTIFHRVIKGFMIQGGGYDSDLHEKRTSAPIRNEADNGLRNKKYTIAMARTSDPHSATSQFFINTKDNDFLDFKAQNGQGWGYAVFGKVIEGQKVVDKIESVLTGSRSHHDDVPIEDVVIKKAYVIEPE